MFRIVAILILAQLTHTAFCQKADPVIYPSPTFEDEMIEAIQEIQAYHYKKYESQGLPEDERKMKSKSDALKTIETYRDYALITQTKLLNKEIDNPQKYFDSLLTANNIYRCERLMAAIKKSVEDIKKTHSQKKGPE